MGVRRTGVVGVVGVVGAVVLVVLAGCGGGSGVREEESGGVGVAEQMVLDAEVPTQAVPSLEEALAQQARRQAALLRERDGVRLEEARGAAVPGWWEAARGDADRYVGSGSAKELARAYDAAVTNAGRRASERGLDPRVLVADRGAYRRLITGEYAVMVVMVPPGVARDATPEVVVPTSDVAVIELPTQSGVVRGVEPGVPTASAAEGGAAGVGVAGAPGWWREGEVRAGGRISVGATAEGGTAALASRAAVRAGRRAIERALGRTVREVTTLRSETVPTDGGVGSGGRFRAWVLVSAPE